jgi:hypothetical protein
MALFLRTSRLPSLPFELCCLRKSVPYWDVTLVHVPNLVINPKKDRVMDTDERKKVNAKWNSIISEFDI